MIRIFCQVLTVACILMILGYSRSLAQAPRANTGATFHRVFVADNSGSMAGKRLETVKQELSSVITQFPPSKSSPVTLITFGSQTSIPASFVDSKSALAAISNIQANGGGTNIPQALFRLAEEIEKLPKASVLAFMFSDGENGEDQHLMQLALAKVNGLFNKRKNRKLSNIVVLHQWGMPNKLNDDLRGMAKSDAITLVETRGFEIATPRVTPEVSITSVRRSKTKHSRVEVVGKAQVQAIGSLPVPLKLTFSLQVRGQSKFKPFFVNANGKSESFRFVIDLSADEVLTGKSELVFTVSEPNQLSTANKIIVPQISPRIIRVPFILPTETFNRFTVIKYGAVPTVPTWENVELLQAKYDIELEFETRSKKEDREGSSTFLIECVSPERIVSKVRKIEVAPNSKKKILLSVVAQSQSKSKSEFQIEFKVRETNIPANVKSLSPQIKLKIDNLSPPPQIVTSIQPKLKSFSRARWVSLAKGTARHNVKIEMKAKGKVVSSSGFDILASQFYKAKIKSQPIQGSTTNVEVSLEQMALAFPNDSDIELVFVPPKPTPAIRYEMKGPLSYRIQGPKAVSLFACSRYKKYHVSCDQTSLNIDLDVKLPNYFRRLESDVAVKMQTQDSYFSSNSAQGKTWGFNTLQLSFPSLQNQSFWLDSQKTGRIGVSAASPSLPIEPTSCELTVVSPAPFKRILLAYIVLPISVLTVGWGVWWGLRPTSE